MATSIEKWIINSLVSILLFTLVFGLFTTSNITGMVTSDEGYKSPTIGPGYIAPKSDESYESPTTGPGYIAPKSDESYESPTTGPGFIRPEVGPGFVKPDTIKVDKVDVVTNQTIEKTKRNESEKKLPKGPIDEKYVGGWRPYQLTNYWKKGGHRSAPTPSDLALNLHKDGTWTWGRDEGTWEVSTISEEDWEKWGIKNEKFTKKIVFHGWPYGTAGTVDGPVEEIPTYVDYIWAVYDVEPPEAEEPAQAWLRFAQGPYTPKEEAVFSELSLVGRWGIYAQGVVYGGRKQGADPSDVTYEWSVKFETTTILEIKADNTWTFGNSKGTWKVLPIEEKDWKKWNLEYYGPRKKIVLEGWENEDEESKNIADGPIEASSGQVNFFWVHSWVIFDEAKPPQVIMLKFRPYESAVSYLTTQVVGSGKITSDDEKINCNKKDEIWGARRGRFFMRYAWVTYIDSITGMATGDLTQCTAEYGVNSEIELKAVPDEGWVFAGWKDACQGNDVACKITMDRSKTVTAEFVPGCKDDSACASEQKCENSICTALQCGCGIAQNHECQKYECCSDDECGEESKCNLNVNRCVFRSECREVVIKGDPANKHDIIFVGYGFQDYEHMKEAINLLMDFDSKSQSKLGVFSITPFKENKDKFNVWMVMAPDYKHNEMPSGYGDIMLNVPEGGDYERFVRTCDRDTVVVMSSELFRSHANFPTQDASGGRVYLSLQNPFKGPEYLGRTLLHELGHAIGGLADEYVEYGSDDRTERFDMPNCAPNLEDAQEKWGNLEGFRGVQYVTGVSDVPGTTYYKHPEPSFPELGYFPDGHDWSDGGCSYVYKNIRPTITSIMLDHYTFDNDYGPVNERVLSKKLEKYEPETDDTWGARRGKFFLRRAW